MNRNETNDAILECALSLADDAHDAVVGKTGIPGITTASVANAAADEAGAAQRSGESRDAAKEDGTEEVGDIQREIAGSFRVRPLRSDGLSVPQLSQLLLQKWRC